MTCARESTNRLVDLLRRERFALADFLVALADFDRQRLWLDLGHASLFYFLHRELGLSKGAAFYRKTAAELIQRFPELIEPLRDGRFCLTTVVELSKVLTRENKAEVLPRFFHLSKSAAKEVSAEINPAAVASRRDVVTAARAPAGTPSHSLTSASPDPGHVAVHPANQPHAVASAEAKRAEAPRSPPPAPAGWALSHAQARQARPESLQPLTADANRLHVTVSRRFLQKLDAARAALSHTRRGAGMEEILEAGLDLLLARHAKRRGLVEKPRREAPQAKAEHVPAHVKRAVWQRDGGRCQWPLERGGVCGSTHQVEIDHVVPRGRGGPSTIENTRLLCRVHNDLAARQEYGDGWMDRFTSRGRAAAPGDAEPARSPLGWSPARPLPS